MAADELCDETMLDVELLSPSEGPASDEELDMKVAALLDVDVAV